MKRPKSYKPLHKVVRAKHVFKNPREVIYGEQWKKYRVEFLKHNTRCYACGAPSTIVDHIEPHKNDIRLFWKVDNYCPLCKKCHDTITSLFDRFHVIGTRPLKKLEFLRDSREMHDLSFKVLIVPFSDDLATWIQEQRILKFQSEGE